MFTSVVPLWRHRELLLVLTSRELFQGHRGHLFGGIWVYANPLLSLAVYFVAFHYIFPARFDGDGGAPEIFLLAGLVQWIVTSETLVKACTVIRQNAGLVKQITFPVEILIGKVVLASLFIQLVMSAGLLLLVLASGKGAGAVGIVCWSGAFLLQSVFLYGAALGVSAVALFAPDIGELVGLIARTGLFVTPILYTAQKFGPTISGLFWLNPFSYFAWIHQTALSGHSVGGGAAWAGAFVLAVFTLWMGSRLFRATSPAFTDVL